MSPHAPNYELASRRYQIRDTVVDVDGVAVGGERFVVIAGPCAVESHPQMLETARAVQDAGAHLLRGGAFKPRTSPYSFQGLGEEGLAIIADVSAQTGMPAFTEVMGIAQLEAVSRHAAGLQIGSRNVQNFELLEAVGRTQKPVLLKRSMGAPVDDLLCAAEYILAAGNPRVILCERGISTFETATRNTLDLNAVPVIKDRSHLPVIVDPSHGTGVRKFVRPMALAAAACGADGLLVEVHRAPHKARSDGHQSLDPEQFAELMEQLEAVLGAVGRTL